MDTPIAKPEHTDQVKKGHSGIEHAIKKALTEVITLDYLADPENYIRNGLSIQPNFNIRELSNDENQGNRMSIAHIKCSTLEKTDQKIIRQLFDLIDEQIWDEIIAEAYKEGISNFFKMIRDRRIEALMKNKTLSTFLKQCKDEYSNKRGGKEGYDNEEIGSIIKLNIISQVAKLVWARFWKEAFLVPDETKNDTSKDSEREKIRFSPLCEKYCQLLFANAIHVRKEWGHNINEVFHDGDFFFITDNTRGNMEEYLDALEYLINKEKHNPFWRRNEHWEGNKAWAKKTSQFTDILWALSNEKFWLHHHALEERESLEFSWDILTKKIAEEAKSELEIKIDTYNTHFLNPEKEKELKLSARNKSLASAVEKIIEGKNLTDIIGLRVSTEGIEQSIFNQIQDKVILPRFQEFSSNIKLHPEKFWLKNGESLKIKKIEVDNKKVLNEEQVTALLETLKKASFNAERRVKAPSSFIDEKDWKEKMEEVYPEDCSNKLAFRTFLAFFKQFSGGSKRGSNGSYHDFKFNIEIAILNTEGKQIGERRMEIQFDDINNNQGLANFNIRNIERMVNTQSNLTFDLSLEQIRKITETNLKKMREWAKDKAPTFQTINFWENEESIDLNILKNRRSTKNDAERNKAIIKIINYFIKKGTFLLVCKDLENKKNLPIENWVLKEDALTHAFCDEIHICAVQEISRQMYSYLWTKWNYRIGIYNTKNEWTDKWKGETLRAPLKDITDRINLGKTRYKDQDQTEMV